MFVISCFIIVLAGMVSPGGNPDTTAKGSMAQFFALFVLCNVAPIAFVGVICVDKFEGT